VAQKVVANIDNSRQQGLDRLLAGLGISHVGNRVAFKLAQHFGSLDAIAKASEAELSAVGEVGEVIAKSVADYFAGAGKTVVKQLQAVGVDPQMEKPAASEQPLAGQTIVVTGTLNTLDRNEIEGLIQKLGGKASGSVSKKTSFLVAGESAGSKLDKAKTLGVPVITEAEFLKKIGR
jgi:DNA ligase (NAD+)